MTRFRWAPLVGAALLYGCAAPAAGTKSEPASVAVRQGSFDRAAPAIQALQQGSFDRAGDLAERAHAVDPDNPYPLLVRAIVRYEKAMRQLALDGRTIVVGALDSGVLNQKYLRSTLEDAESELAAVEAYLAAVARNRGVAIELCLACWEIDWNGNGRVDRRDRRLLQIERDDEGHEIPEGDPRRKPTFRFDDGDVPWARAFVSFERAALDIALAYDVSDLAALARRRRDRPDRIVLRLVAPDRIAAAKQRILEGLDFSDAARRAYLAETDDDREWVPSPRQKSHPMPLAVDDALYGTWQSVVGDVRRLVRGDEGLRVADALTLLGERSARPPKGYLDIGHMLSHPKDIVLDLPQIRRLADEDIESAMKSVLGDHYVASVKPSPLPTRLRRMKDEIERHDDELGRKLRYLFWLN